MSDYAFAAKDGDEADEKGDMDVETPSTAETADTDGGEEIRHAQDDPHEQASNESGSEVTATSDDTSEVLEEEVYLDWADEYGIHEEGRLPLREAVEENARILTDSADRFEIENVEEEIEQLETKVGALAAQLDALEAWKQDVIEALDGQGQEIGLLLTASDIADAGMCPECGAAPLEVKNRALSDSTIECSNGDCDHVAAKMR